MLSLIEPLLGGSGLRFCLEERSESLWESRNKSCNGRLRLQRKFLLSVLSIIAQELSEGVKKGFDLLKSRRTKGKIVFKID